MILAKYPQVKKLMGADPKLAPTVFFMVIAQIITAYLLKDASWFSIIVVGYCWGGVINHSMALAIHEISHNLAFGYSRPWANRLLGIFGNLPMAIPYSTVFKKYHLEHHKYQGDDELDVDIPTRIEAKLFYNTFTKFIWVLLQPLFYAIRPLFLRPKAVTMLEILNFTVQAAFDAAIFYYMGHKSLVYMAASTFLAMGLHPVAGHFISEHYMFKKGYETYSYYGILNAITFNVGYHNEHHDFPNIPGSRLPQLKAMAPEFYDNLPCHHSWSRVIYDFIFDPDIGPYSRVKRKRIPFPGEDTEKEE
jgi:sphingolipid delta-4 desaturase